MSHQLTPRTRRLLLDARASSFTPEIQALTATDRAHLEPHLSEGTWRQRAPMLAAIRALLEERRAILTVGPHQAAELQYLAHLHTDAPNPIAQALTEHNTDILVLCGFGVSIPKLLRALPGSTTLYLPTPCPYHHRITLRRLLDTLERGTPQMRAHTHVRPLTPSTVFQAAG